MNTSGVQNYLSNVFRPIYTFDTTASNFTPRLELSNVDTYSGNVVSVFRADVGDSASNVYVGSNSGNSFSNTRDCEKITALGVGAANGISDDSNSIYIGWYAGSGGSNSQDVISIGTESGEGNGSSNIFLGTETGTIGASNILIGHFINLPSVSNQIRIGYRDQIPIAADLSKNWVGLGGILNPTDIVYATTDISGSTRIQGNLGINIAPGTRTLDVNGNFRSQDASANLLEFADGFTRSTGGYVSIQRDISVNATATTIGTLKKGNILISAVNQSNAADYASRLIFAYTTSNAVDIGSNVTAGDASITLSASDIQITDITNTTSYDYSITYFPLP
jgi:hypothetical protein